MLHEDYKEMLPAGALAALDAEEERALRTHLESCAECRNDLRDWQAICANLALAVDPQSPSNAVRDRILAQIRTEDRKGDAFPNQANMVPFRIPRKNLWDSLGSFGAIAAAFLFIALAVSVIILWQKNRSMQAELAKLASEINTARGQLAQEQKVIQLLTTPGSKMAELSPTSSAPGAKAMLAYDKTGHAMLVAKGLPLAPQGKAYQLWYIVANKAPMPGKVFTMDASGNGMMEDQMPAVAMNQADFAVTLEPEAGVQTPTGAILLRSGS